MSFQQRVVNNELSTMNRLLKNLINKIKHKDKYFQKNVFEIFIS